MTLLVLPGILGSVSKGTLKTIIWNLDHKKYTIIVWDAPGFGLSRPPDRNYAPGFFYRDADYAISLMKILNINKYSVLGWCFGGVTAMIVASKAIDNVEKLIQWGAISFVTENDLKYYRSMRSNDAWPPIVIQKFFDIYGEEYFTKTWQGLVDTVENIAANLNGDICQEALSKIMAPTLVIHGTKDEAVDMKHPLYIQNNIKKSSLELIQDGTHHMHISHYNQLNSLIDNFLSGNYLPHFN
ncbi:valacyclovir hydrolase-like isoform X2 [Daktulosphaira vitifoliae]|nr:valacyclovir hydrolase-like isoform X2 [Daktulosphaira vitifoliae]